MTFEIKGGWSTLNADHPSARISRVAYLFAFGFCLPAAGRKRWGRFSLPLLLGTKTRTKGTKGGLREQTGRFLPDGCTLLH
jgi:hypothetical protein